MGVEPPRPECRARRKEKRKRRRHERFPIDKVCGDVPSPNFQYQYSSERADWGTGGSGGARGERGKEGYGGRAGTVTQTSEQQVASSERGTIGRAVGPLCEARA